MGWTPGCHLRGQGSIPIAGTLFLKKKIIKVFEENLQCAKSKTKAYIVFRIAQSLFCVMDLKKMILKTFSIRITMWLYISFHEIL